VSQPVITFLSDYGLADWFVGVCHGVIATVCPQARVIDITHGVPRHEVRAGALILRGSLPFMPVGVHLAVVDPGVGAERRAIAVQTDDGRVLVGPDNGLLMLAAERFGGVVEAVDASRSKFRLEPVSATFHGRDIFAPVAAQLACGVVLADAGDPCDPATLVTLEVPESRIENGTLVTHALYIDRFGNVALGVEHDDLAGTGLRLGHRAEISLGVRSHEAQYALTFADVEPGALLLYENSHRRLALAVSHGDAAASIGLAVDDELRIKPK
jgi:S-adenosylmethionine hydrolase